MLEKIYEALYCYGEPELWETVKRNGMSVDNSWDAAAWNYIAVYDRLSRM
jgi:glycogen synthase